jgi:hypothetical protein
VYKYIVEKSTVNYNWKYERMLPSLPGPGSDAFVELCKQLHPFGLSPASMTLDAYSQQVSDIAIGMGLLKGRMAVRLTLGGIDILVGELFEDDEVSIIEVVNYLVAAVCKIDPDAVNGSAEVRTSSHLSLLGADVDSYLSNFLQAAQLKPELMPVTIVYLIDKAHGINSDELRLLLAKSLMHKNAIFIDINATYGGKLDPALFAQWINEDFNRSMELLDLEEGEV